ncbi:hypothetical protein IX315_001904 [Porphyromonas levii]|nr:hypothetical protein [Porphyromonas levii]
MLFFSFHHICLIALLTVELLKEGWMYTTLMDLESKTQMQATKIWGLTTKECMRGISTIHFL